jgi:hypothetical protein
MSAPCWACGAAQPGTHREGCKFRPDPRDAEIAALRAMKVEFDAACRAAAKDSPPQTAGAERLCDVIAALKRQLADALAVADYEEVLADHRRLAREIDVALHGEDGAAKQASLCDLVPLARRLREERDTLAARDLAAEQGEPVAWRWYEEKFGEYRYNEHGPNPHRMCEPLYAALEQALDEAADA